MGCDLDWGTASPEGASGGAAILPAAGGTDDGDSSTDSEGAGAGNVAAKTAGARRRRPPPPTPPIAHPHPTANRSCRMRAAAVRDGRRRARCRCRVLQALVVIPLVPLRPEHVHRGAGAQGRRARSLSGGAQEPLLSMPHAARQRHEGHRAARRSRCVRREAPAQGQKESVSQGNKER